MGAQTFDPAPPIALRPHDKDRRLEVVRRSFSYAAIAASAIAAWSWGGLCKVTIAYVCGIEAGVSMV